MESPQNQMRQRYETEMNFQLKVFNIFSLYRRCHSRFSISKKEKQQQQE